MNIEEIKSLHIDAISEISNIGCGNAATSLSQLLSTPVDVSLPKVCIVKINDMIEFLGGSEKIVVAVMTLINRDINGLMTYLIDEEFASVILKTILDKDNLSIENLDEISTSALNEIANILMGSYINAISKFTNLSVNMDVPQVCIDMVGAILNLPATQLYDSSDNLIYVSQNFSLHNRNISSKILLFPDTESLSKIMKIFGI